ncbi:MAG: serine/threonine-protein kinase [Anaerolineaceae bacterium]
MKPAWWLLLDNPNIVPVYELSDVDGRVFIAMKYLPGGSLKQKIENEGAIPFPETLKIINDICNGLQEAHEKGLVHLDVKPANILFDKKGRAVIGDFGLARAVQLSGSATSGSSGIGAGTPAYRAPELWRGKPPASPATDVYSLGCVLSEMLTGRVLFSGNTPDEILARHLIDGPDIPERFPEGTPEGVRAVLEKAVAKEPLERYQVVTAFEKALEGCGLAPAEEERKEPEKPGDMKPAQSAPAAPGSKNPSGAWPVKKIGIAMGVIVALGMGVWLLGGTGRRADNQSIDVAPTIQETRECSRSAICGTGTD